MSLDTEVHSLAGPYALNALPEPERARFEQHLEDCPACRHEAVELLTTAAHLTAISGAAPPAHLRERIRVRISQVRQLPPRPRFDDPRPRRRTYPRRKLLLAAAAAVVLAAGGGATAVQLANSREAANRRDQIAAVMSAPDAQTLHGDVTGGGRLTAVLSRQTQAAVVIVDRVPALPRDRTYQLWLRDGKQARPAGLLTADADQPTTRIVRQLGTADALSLTIEPDGGSARPTPPIIATVPFLHGTQDR